jgi:hypothetical protein
MYSVSVREDGGFGFTKARVNIDEAWSWYAEDSGGI